MTGYTEQQKLVNRNGIYRAAFPSYRVFIYGEDVSSDVVEVRVNQSGGSAERAAGSCSFTMVNPGDKYTINYKDMQSIIKAKKLADKLTAQEIQDFMNTFINASGLLWEDIVFDTMVNQDDPEAFFDENEYKERLDDLKKKYEESKKIFEVDLAKSFNWDMIEVFVKRRVLQRKLKFSIEIEPKTDTNLVKYDKKIIQHYPIRVGDCIFHPNDPIRIAFRDPYDPRVWYWMFSGFMDSFTESSGPNKESMVTINATDVSKTARYAYVQENTGFFEGKVEEAGNVGFLAQELFAGFTIFEILETLFFGSESLYSFVTEPILSAISGMTEMQRYNALASLAPSLLEGTPTKDAYFTELAKAQIEDRLNKLHSLNLPPITHPRNVLFKRKSPSIGVSAYFFGEVDEHDKNIGEQILSLKKWNDILHPQVKREDLREMINDQIVYTPSSENLTIEQIIYEIGTGSVTDSDNGALGTVAPYPIGNGKVYYFSWGKLNGELARSVIDKSISANKGMHSIFRDKLSYLYDTAERVDFRFYATPRGDLVFEMPFYDIDLEDFTYGTGKQPDLTDFSGRVEDFYERYDNIFQKAYDGKYEGVADELSNLLFQTEAAKADLEAYDYNSIPKPDYARIFTIEDHETVGFNNTITDQGVITSYRCIPKITPGFEQVHNKELVPYVTADAMDLKPMLGERKGEGDVLGFIATAEAAESYGALTMNRMNAEAHNISIQTLPKFGLMVNRPLFWRHRCYQATIVSVQHSIVWNSTCDTTINANQIRAWDGNLTSNGRPMFKHFDGDRPFNLAKLMIQGATSQNDNQGD